MHLCISMQVLGDRSSIAVSTLLVYICLMSLPDQYPDLEGTSARSSHLAIHAATFWDALATLPPISLYIGTALEACA